MILLCLYLVFGLIAAIFGIYIGRKASKQPLEIDSLTTAQVLEIKSKKDNLLFHFSYIWLLCNVLFLVAELALMSYLRWEYWTIFGLSILIIWSIRYKRSLKPLAKPKFWLFFVLLTMISGFVLFKINNSDSGFFKGLLIGLEMNFRAVITIVGFASIGTELRNPKFRNILANSHIRQLPIALEVAFDTLPLVISNLPKLQDVFKRPVKTFHELVSQADFWLEKFEFKIIKKENVVILRGIEKTGKSTCLKNIVENLKRKNIKAGGFISPSVFENNILIGYDLVDVLSNKRVVLSRTYGNEEMPKVGSYYFNKYCIDFGKQLFDINNLTDIEIVVIDEVGPWEIKNQGWAKSLNQLIRSFEKPMIWVVRESIVDKVVENWSLKNPMIIDIKENNIDMICDKIFSLLKKQYN
jgi:nucleoside-triphosphatase THEP1